jgi:hypothetical protein
MLIIMDFGERIMGKYYTVQKIEGWKEAQTTGYLSGHPDYVWNTFLEPYHWMMKQMEKRIPNYEGEYPIWVWTERQDLRRAGYFEPGTRGVQLELNIPDEKVLLSDFNAWHIVLNNDSLLVNDEENISKEESWERIFEFDFLVNQLEWGDIDSQGVTGKVSLRDIKLIKEFTCR